MMKLIKNRQFTTLILSTLVLVPAFAFFASLITSPSDGARLEPGSDNFHPTGVEVNVLRSQPGGLITGDIVTAIENRSMEAWAQAVFTPGIERPDWQSGDTVRYTVNRSGQAQAVQVFLGDYPLAEILRSNWGTILFAVVFLIVATYIFIRRPANHAGRILFLSAACILSATTWSFGLHLYDFVTGSGFWLYKITTLGAYSLFWITGFHFAAIFPKPLPVIEKKPWLLMGGYLLASCLILIWIAVTRTLSASTLEWLGMWVAIEAIVAGLFLTLALTCFFFQYRIHKTGITRLQIRWVIWAALLSGGAGLFFYILPSAIGGSSINPNLAGVIVLPFPLAFAVAILRHNLFEIDRLINRTIVYGSLTISAGGIYLLVVGAFGIFFQAQGNWVISLIATGVVAILFHPLREWINRWVNRRMYGDRDEPFEVLARLGQRLETTLSPGAVLPTLVETIAQALKLPYVGLLLDDSGSSPVASYGKPTTSTKSYPLLNQGEPVGQLIIARRAQDEDFNENEERLLSSIARQAGAAVHTVLLTADLQLSRQRLVTAQEEERRRLRRDLHDGLGPTLAAHLLKIGLTRSYLNQDVTRADGYLELLEEETEGLLAEIRRLVYNLRPPTLDQLGLVGAIKASADEYNHASEGRQQMRVEVLAPGKIPALPAAVEVAAYRIVLEALTNASRHAQATCCMIEFNFKNGLHLKISDNGHGIPSGHRPGVGLNSMRERAVELGGRFEVHSSNGGGTKISVIIPFQEFEEKKG